LKRGAEGWGRGRLNKLKKGGQVCRSPVGKLVFLGALNVEMDLLGEASPPSAGEVSPVRKRRGMKN